MFINHCSNDNLCFVMAKFINETNKKKNIANNMIISGICKPISMLISYLYVPIILSYLGVEKYGVWSTILTILSWIGYCDIGIGNGLRNKLTESLSNKDYNARRLVSSAYGFSAFIMISVAVVLTFVTAHVDWNRVFGVQYPNNELVRVISVSINLIAISFILSTCKNILYSLQKAADVSVIEMVVQLVNLIGVLIARRMTQGSLFLIALIYGMSLIIVNGVASIWLFARNGELKPSIKFVDIATGKSITNLGIQFFIIQICSLVLFSTDSLIISILYGASDVTPYNTVNRLFSFIIGIYTALLAPIWSAVTKAKIEKKYKDLDILVKRLVTIMIPFALVTVIIGGGFRTVARFWLGQELQYSNLLILFGVGFCLLSLWCNTFSTVANGLELTKQSIIIAVVQAIINIPLSLFLAKNIGLQNAGVLAGTVISMMISAFIHPIIVFRHIRFNLNCKKIDQ